MGAAIFYGPPMDWRSDVALDVRPGGVLRSTFVLPQVRECAYCRNDWDGKKKRCSSCGSGESQARAVKL